MANLDPRADRAVRDAVDAFMEGRLVPEFSGETVFETKNSRYRLRDGVVYAAPDESLAGAELVGWLCESSRRCLVESAWQHGARAVLVDRRRGRNIIVTSTTRILHIDESGAVYPVEPVESHEIRSWHPPPTDAPLDPFSPRHAPIIASTPPPPAVAPPALQEPPPPPKRTIPPPVAIPPPSPFMAAAAAQRSSEEAASKRAGVHMPPRPISRPRAVIPATRPLPAPIPPPRRSSPLPVVTLAKVIVPAPPALPAFSPPATEWEITSAEMEIVEPPSIEPVTLQQPEPQADDAAACQAEEAIPFELARPITTENEPVNSDPFPLVRPLDAGTPSPRR